MSSKNIYAKIIIIVFSALLLSACEELQREVNDDYLNRHGNEINANPDKVVTGKVINKESDMAFFAPWFRLGIEDEIQGRYSYRTTYDFYDIALVGDSLTITYKWNPVHNEYYIYDMVIK